MADPSAPTAPATRPERCSNCDAKLPDTPVSLCPYCAMPLLEGAPGGGGEAGGASPHAERVAKVKAHEDFAEALTLEPPEGPEHEAGVRRQARGVALLVAAGLCAAVGATGRLWALVLAGVAAVLGVVAVARGAAARRRAVAQPLLKRAGVITDRRSETQEGVWSGSTTYYFTIELEGGVVGEFAWPGHGPHDEPYVTNLPGVAYTRGQRLLFFRHVRV